MCPITPIRPIRPASTDKTDTTDRSDKTDTTDTSGVGRVSQNTFIFSRSSDPSRRSQNSRSRYSLKYALFLQIKASFEPQGFVPKNPSKIHNSRHLMFGLIKISPFSCFPLPHDNKLLHSISPALPFDGATIYWTPFRWGRKIPQTLGVLTYLLSETDV